MRSCFDVKQGSFNNKPRVMLHTAEAPSILAPSFIINDILAKPTNFNVISDRQY